MGGGAIEPSPPWWRDVEAARRARCARNHVRLLLRGARWQQDQLARRMRTGPYERPPRPPRWHTWLWGRAVTGFFWAMGCGSNA